DRTLCPDDELGTGSPAADRAISLRNGRRSGPAERNRSQPSARSESVPQRISGQVSLARRRGPRRRGDDVSGVPAENESGRQMMHKGRGFFVLLVLFVAIPLSGYTQEKSQIHVLRVQGNVYMLVGADANIAVQVASDGVLMVDTGTA